MRGVATFFVTVLSGVLGLVATAIGRWCADLPPAFDGREVELAIKVRCPRGM